MLHVFIYYDSRGRLLTVNDMPVIFPLGCNLVEDERCILRHAQHEKNDGMLFAGTWTL